MGLVGLLCYPLNRRMGVLARCDIRLRISSDTDRIWTCLAAGACFLSDGRRGLDLANGVAVGSMAMGLGWLSDFL